MTEVATTDPVVEPAGEPTAPIIDAEGNLREGWREDLPEDIRAEKVFDRVKNFQGIMKSLASAERMVGKDKIAIPGDKSTDVEWEAFYQAAGRPETPQDYNLKAPEDLPEGAYTKDRLEGAQKLFHKLGLSNKQAQALMEYDQGIARQFIKDREKQKTIDRENAKNDLLQLWGNAYEQRIHFGDRAISEGVAGDAEFQDRITEKFGDEPDFIRLLSNLGAKFTERGAIRAANIPTPSDIETEINEAIQHPAYLDAKHPQHEQQVKVVQRLTERKVASTRTG
jgi:hypothetical protein